MTAMLPVVLTRVVPLPLPGPRNASTSASTEALDPAPLDPTTPIAITNRFVVAVVLFSAETFRLFASTVAPLPTSARVPPHTSTSSTTAPTATKPADPAAPCTFGVNVESALTSTSPDTRRAAEPRISARTIGVVAVSEPIVTTTTPAEIPTAPAASATPIVAASPNGPAVTVPVAETVTPSTETVPEAAPTWAPCPTNAWVVPVTVTTTTAAPTPTKPAAAPTVVAWIALVRDAVIETSSADRIFALESPLASSRYAETSLRSSMTTTAAATPTIKPKPPV